MSFYPLPELYTLDNFDEKKYNEYIENLYEYFLHNIANGLTFLNMPIKCRYHKAINDMHGSFWHLITETYDEGHKKLDEDRIVDPRRSERLLWIPYILNNYDNNLLKCWENKRGIVIWLEEENYMIVLSRRKDCFYLVTAYIHDSYKTYHNRKELKKYSDPRKKLEPPV